jgi:hypothetical protein
MRGVVTRDGTRVRLEACRIGGKWFTSVEAIERFAEATTPRFDDDAVTPPRTQAARQAESAKAAKELQKAGI